MPIKLSLVFVKKYQQHKAYPHSYNHHYYHERNSNTQLLVEKVAQQQPKGISLRRVLGVPKTSCKSCRG
jgi:hypothetical protein